MSTEQTNRTHLKILIAMAKKRDKKIVPIKGKSWLQCMQTWPEVDEAVLWYNVPKLKHSTHIVKIPLKGNLLNILA